MSFRVLGVGKVVWDLPPAGALPGAAPANFACHARALGADGGLAGVLAPASPNPSVGR